jgi:hypothetical protein
MRDILSRLYKIAKADAMSRLKIIGDSLFGDLEKNAEKIGESYRKKKMGERLYNTKSGGAGGAGAPKSQCSKAHCGIPRQILDDLAIFGLRPPCSWDEVKKARNREIKKYHSDHFIDDPVRYDASKEIMQIYNASYDRLKKYYKKRESK